MGKKASSTMGKKASSAKPLEGWADAIARASLARAEKLRISGILIPEVQEGTYQNVSLTNLPSRVKDPSGKYQIVNTPVLLAENLLLPVELTNKPKEVFSTLNVLRIEKNENGYITHVVIE